MEAILPPDFTGQQGLTSQKFGVFIITAVWTSNPTYRYIRFAWKVLPCTEWRHCASLISWQLRTGAALLYTLHTTTNFNSKLLIFNLSRLLEETSLATTLQDVYLIFYIFSPLHVSALVDHLGSYSLTTDQLFCVIGFAYCLANTGVVFSNMCFLCVCKLSKLGQITSLLNIKNFKMSKFRKKHILKKDTAVFARQ
jgi:hypothetical protein